MNREKLYLDLRARIAIIPQPYSFWDFKPQPLRVGMSVSDFAYCCFVAGEGYWGTWKRLDPNDAPWSLVGWYLPVPYHRFSKTPMHTDELLYRCYPADSYWCYSSRENAWWDLKYDGANFYFDGDYYDPEWVVPVPKDMLGNRLGIVSHLLSVVHE